MDSAHPTELAVLLLSTSFLAALIVGGIAGRLGGMMLGAGAGMVVVSAMSLAAAWIAWRGGDPPDRGMVRVEGRVELDAGREAAGSPAPALTNHDFVILYADASGREHRLSGAYAQQALAPGARLSVDYHPEAPDRGTVRNPGEHRTLLIAFLLFGTIPLAMSLVMFAEAWERRTGATPDPAPRPAALLKACSWARVFANVALLAGFYLALRESNIAAIGTGFPVIGAAALAHGVIGVVSGMRLGGALIFFVIATGFIGFGFFAQSVS